MGLPRTFVGFSSTDIKYYWMMLAWKENQHIDFNFVDCQLQKEIDSENEQYIKRLCRERINMAGKFIQVIGQDTRSKHKFVRWELEVAIEKKCTIIGVNLDMTRAKVDATCPPLMSNIGALFIPFSPKIIAYALQNEVNGTTGAYHYLTDVYQRLGYA